MNWIIALGLAIAAFAVIAAMFRLPHNCWIVLLATLLFGLAGYAFQASPGLAGAPKQTNIVKTEEGWRIVDLRKQLVGERRLSGNKLMITADALVRQGQYANAARLLRGIVKQNPRDAEAWLAMANALTFHADGALTPAALLAYRRAAQAAPDGAGPSFFVGLALIREGQLIEGRELWADRLEKLPEGAPGREILAERLGQLDELLRRIVENADEIAR